MNQSRALEKYSDLISKGMAIRHCGVLSDWGI